VAVVVRADADGISTLTLNRPDKLNAITRQMMIELREHVEAIAVDDTVGCVILTGAGRCFGAGHDLADTGHADEGRWRHFDAETVDRLETIPQPIIAAVHGHCITGSLELALGCDLVVAAESASFRDSHGRWGLVPIWGMSVRLPERVGRARALDLGFTGRAVDGREALALGLADRCVPDDSLLSSARELARSIVANSRGTNGRLKRLLHDQATMTRTAALAYERTRPYGLAPDREARRPGA
jgi:enoyl-CoA hydratase/carnithine racemase